MPKRIVALMPGFLLVIPAITPAHAVENVTAIERAQLPTYCYAQLVDKKLAGQPGYSIPRSCGVGMNHLCGGFIKMIRAKHPASSPRERKTFAAQAIGNFKYTLRHMSDNQDCPLRTDVERALLEAQAIAGKMK